LLAEDDITNQLVALGILKKLGLRADAVLNGAEVLIAMTANAMQGDRELCLEAGMNDYITKPVSPQALAEMLDKWLPKSLLDRACKKT